MSEVDQPERIIRFPKGDSKKPSSTERIWGKPVLSHGYTAIPSILIQAQSRLGITPLQMNIIIQLLDYWLEPEFTKAREVRREVKRRAETPVWRRKA